MGLPVVVEVEPDHVEVGFIEGLGGGQQVVGRLADDVLAGGDPVQHLVPVVDHHVVLGL